jgi:hypothetical protein
MSKDTLSGLLFIAIGSFFCFFSLDYKIGIISEMGPGFFPFLIGTILVLVGLIVVIKGKYWKS